MLAIFFFSFFGLTSFGQSGKNKITLPNLIGMTLREAKKVLVKSNLGIGAIITSGNIDLDVEADSLIVYRQNPSSKSNTVSSNYLKKNKLIDIWLTRNNGLNSLNKPKQRNRKSINDFR